MTRCKATGAWTIPVATTMSVPGPINPMTLVQVYPIGIIRMLDGGRNDDKIIAIPFSDPNYNSIKHIDDLPRHILEEMQHFFKVYKQLENKETDIRTLYGRDEALRIIGESIAAYREKYVKSDDSDVL